jgi:arabinose-5-phosphate isomerase
MDFLAYAREILAKEAEALRLVSGRLNADFAAVCRLVLEGKGSVAVSGVGKAGLVGRKISATLASTGTRSYWLDPLNALHGDLGMTSPDDLALLLSNSGTSGEMLLVAEALGGLGVRRVAITRSAATTLGQLCEYRIEIGDHEEAGHLRMAPSTSTTVMLALGDALALTVAKARGLDRDTYAKLHPAGALGRRLKNVCECMRTGDRIAVVGPDVPLAEAICAITQARCGLCVVADGDGKLLGVYTDGDFRRDWVNGKKDLLKARIGDHMVSPCKRVDTQALVADALEVMHAGRINSLPVVDEDGRVAGVLDVQDLV